MLYDQLIAEPQDPELTQRTQSLFDENRHKVFVSTDHFFALLMTIQWVGAIVTALVISPQTWAGTVSNTHIHVWVALLLGGLITSLPVYMALVASGQTATRHVIAIGQLLMSALLIHLTGGRIETHFHVFGSLAFLAFYRDWRVLITASLVVVLDHVLRGFFWPQSVYGVNIVQPWRWIEHSFWVVFEDIFLTMSINRSLREMWSLAAQQARLERTNATIEIKVVERTSQLQHEVTQRRQAEEALADRATQLDNMNKKLIEAERLKDQWLANVSHELRTPLTLILAPLESALSATAESTSSEQHEHLETIRNNALRLLQLVSGLLDFSKLEAGKMQVQRTAANVSALTQSIVADFQPTAIQRGLTLKLDSQLPEMAFNIDRYVYERILFNLLSNALKFTPRGGNIDVALSAGTNCLTLSVTDTGIGIAEDNMSHLFEKFRQLDDASSRRIEGTGLGLAMVKEFAELLGGSASVESEFGKGSTFTVTLEAEAVDLSLVEESPVEKLTPTIIETQDGTTKSGFAENGHQAKVIVAEDNIELATYMMSLLKQFCQVRLATDGDEAWELVKEWSPDLVLTDVMMPGRDGLSLCREIKSNLVTESITVVMITALTHREAMLKGWQAGADEYLFKPFHPTELVTRIKTLLSGIERRKKAEEFQRDRERLADLAQRLSTSNAELQQFAYVASHDLQEPLRITINYVDLLTERLKDQLDFKSSMYMRHITDAVTRMRSMIQDLLDFAKVESSNRNLKEIECNVLVDRVLSNWELPLREVGAEVTRDELPAIVADDIQLSQVFQNLISNAIKYRRDEPPKVHIAARLEGKEWIFTVSDNGLGIAPEFRERIFEIFKRLHTTDEYSGTGIGLAICKKILDRHGGRIWVDSQPGIGSNFMFTLPVRTGYSKEDSGAEVAHSVG